jgi:hypothetical protein
MLVIEYFAFLLDDDWSTCGFININRTVNFFHVTENKIFFRRSCEALCSQFLRNENVRLNPFILRSYYSFS